ncbi:ATP-binding cassette domain-containing protein [Crocinitomicaceae bacterium]|nr:ATP-binding cassette domain-containing protein [Crocinitomicaceae bacterium]
MIRLDNIGVQRDHWVFRNLNFSISQGDVIGIIGTSGIGKTTLLKVISGLLDASEGTVFFNQEPILGPSVKLVPGYEDIQLVHQDFGLDPYHTVEENVREKILNLHKADQVHLVEELLSLVELDHLRDRKAVVLSGGEQQRLAIARALACEPRVLLLDEPFVHIDHRLRLKISNYLLKLNEVRGTSIVLVSHDGSEIMGFAKRIIHLDSEGVNRMDSLNNVFYYPDSIEQAQLMGLINQVDIDGTPILFRPSEYEHGDELSLRFLHSIDSGFITFNYFKTLKGEEVVLTSDKILSYLTSISIAKK